MPEELLVAPTPTRTASGTLAPPPSKPSRSHSSASSRSNGSSRSRGSQASSASLSRSNSHSSHGINNTTTISGGTSIGGGKAKGASNDSRRSRKGDKSASRGSSSQGKSRPNPIQTGRPSSANKDKAPPLPSPVRSIHASSSAPVTAMEAAVTAATKKHQEQHGGNALTSLQKMISDLKAIPPASATSGGSAGSRSTSVGKDKSPQASPAISAAVVASVIPAHSTKLKADAPSFTPSVRSSPVVSASVPQQQRAASQGTHQLQPQQSQSQSQSQSQRRMSTSSVTSNPYAGYNSMSNLMSSPIQSYQQTLPHFPLVNLSYPNQLSVHPEAENEDLSPMAYMHHADAQYQQQQLLAAQQLQLQLLQAQIVQQQIASQQQQREQGFIAPRFQALAAQRVALQQQQQQAVQLAEAQRLFEMHQQQQLLLLAQQQQQQEEARLAAQQVLHNPPPVFEEEEDSPDQQQPHLGPTGRPQLNPGFTFGKPRRESTASPEEVKPLRQPIIVNRSEGIGGAAATGLAGLAARAHKRTGSELTPAMEKQLELQKQIDALQAEQKALMQQELAGQPSGLDQLTSLHRPSPSQTIARHRRSQSSISSAVPVPNSSEPYNSLLLSTPEQPERETSKIARSFGDMPPPPVPTSHSRRHSVNVFNKTAGSGAGFGGGMSGDFTDDGSTLGTSFGHHRSGSRGFESGNWRVSGGGSVVGGGNNLGSLTADLASAQAQLASLAQFRAASGSGHAKMASFAFPNMLPNILAAATLQNPAGQSSLWQQQQSFQMQLQQTTQGPTRKSLFAPYLPQASLPPLLSAGKLVVGILRVNKKNRSDAYVATDVLDADIYICGSKDRNRALEGDIVAIELLDVDEVWNTKKDKEEKKRKKEESYDVKPSAAKKLEKKKDDVEVEGQGLTLFEDEEVNEETKPAFAGHVVAVVERMPGQLFSGQLGVLRPSSALTKEKQEAERREREGDKAKKDEPEQRPKIVWFKPTDKRVPLIAIPTDQAPADFVDNPDLHVNKLFVATIKRWPITSLHPFGTLVEELGPLGDSEVETSAILKDCNFPTEEFTEVTLKCLPPLPWSIPEREYDVRADLRNERVFTIDPPTARDLDDALSIKTNEDGTYTVGVHIADVSYFVKANTALDRDARKRATSVYLIQRAVPMLPPPLSEQLCSLVPDVERLTFTATFVIDKEGRVLDKSYRRSVIKSTAQLSYADAEKVIAGGKLSSSKVTNSHPAQELEKDILLLHHLASKIRANRIATGAMASPRRRLGFTLDESGRPVDCLVDEPAAANDLVEEFMLLTNMSIAAVIANGLPEQALLRRHEAPIERRIDAFVERAKRWGYSFDSKNAGTMQKSFDAIGDKEDAMCLNLLSKKSMQTARYFCTGMLDIAKYGHWALNAPLYTHFTSPIRKYADVLVHRMLDACLSSPSPVDVKFHMDRDQIAKCAQQCNMKRQSARLAEDQSAHLFLCMLLNDLSERHGPVIRRARVTAVHEQAFDVIIPEFGIEKRIHVDKMPLENSVFDEHANVLSLYWSSQDALTFLAKSDEDEHLLRIKNVGDRIATGTTDTVRLDNASFTGSSLQYKKSATQSPFVFEGLRKTNGGHRIQDVKEFSTLPVIVTADMARSPPVIVVYACNPYAAL